MKDCTRRGELLFRWVCLVLVYSVSVESLNWTTQPANPKELTEGQDVSLTWSYTLTADELTKSATFFKVTWRKFNGSDYNQLAFYNKFTGSPPSYAEQAPHIVVDRATGTNLATLQFNDVRTDDEGMYKIDISVEFPGTVIAAFQEVNLTVVVPSNIANVSSDQVVCEGSMVTLSCNATGKPTPSITWTRAFDNGTDSAPLLPVVDGKYVMNNIMRSSNGTYRCTADNGVGDPANRTVRVTVRYSASDVTIVNSSNAVNEGGSFNMTCEASGDPKPNVHWIKVDNGQRIDGNILNFTNINRNDTGQYRCEAENDCGSDSRVQSIEVYYPPNITNISENRTVNQSETVNPTCTADGNPLPSITWTRVSDNSVVKFPLTITGKKDEGFYRCTADNGVGNPDTAEFFIAVQNYGPFGTRLTTNLSDNTAVLNKSFNLNCSAQAKPTAKYRFYKEEESLFNTSTSSYFAVTTTSVSDRKNEVKFNCTPFNEYGDGSSTTITVTVHYAPSVDPKVTEIEITKGDTARYACPVVGNPLPNVTWYEGNGISGSVLASGRELEIENFHLNKSYTCLARNSLGTDTGSVHFRVGEKSTTKETVGIIKITLTISNKNCDTFSEKEFVEKIKKLYESDGIKEVIVKDKRCGSVILDLELHFTKDASESEVITTLKDAAKNNRLGDFKVDPDSIKPTEKESPCIDSLFKDAECDLKVIPVVILVVCVVVVIAFVVGGAIYYWVHKRKKCRKDPRIHNSDDQEALHGNQSGADENAYAQVNGGYADSGPPSVNGTDAAAQQPREGANGTYATVQQQQQQQQQQEQQVQGAPPTSAVVNKLTKKQKKEEEKRKKEKEKKMKEEEKKNKNDAENIPQYAVVDKSLKKKKEVVEDAYAQVDMSKKSKKKPKPGEMLYADLGEFQPRQMPAVSTSPDPLPPVKKPPAYEKTEYADITQFLKGDATLPDTNNSQGTEMTYANVEGGKGKPKETANQGGNEEKPKETRM